MSYLLDKKIKQKRFLYIAYASVIFLILFYFRIGIFNAFSYITQIVFHPFLMLGSNISLRFENFNSLISYKQSLILENENLKSTLEKNSAKIANYNSILNENIKFKEILGRKSEKSVMILANILSKPNQSLYDTLVLDIGADKGIVVGDMVFALGNIPIGRVNAVYPYSTKVVLFSNQNEKTQVIISGKNVFMQLVGRGGGNFEMILPRDFNLQEGTEIVLPGLTPHLIGVVKTIISDPRDSFIKALVASPINIQELKFVEIKK